jgi:hypothetical protein
MRGTTIIVGGSVLAGLVMWVSGCVVVGGSARTHRAPDSVVYGDRHHDQELARLLVKLEKRTRAVVAGHYVQADEAHRDWMARNVLLPAAVADKVFYEVVPAVTGDRAWVKMVVDAPRNPHNTGDSVALTLLEEVKTGSPSAQRFTEEACYYAEPIQAAKTCLLCHGEPYGGPDPYFPQYIKNAWKEGEVIGAIVARVEPGT